MNERPVADDAAECLEDRPLWYNDGKHGNERCPYCGGRSGFRRIGVFLFCLACHRRMPWINAETDGDLSVKELIDKEI